MGDVGAAKDLKLRHSILLVAGLFALSITAGALALTAFFAATLEEVGEILDPLFDLNPVLLLLIIFFNNALKALMIIVLGVGLGILPLFFVAYNGLVIGALLALMKPDVEGAVLAAALLPHGVIEIPLIVLSAALGVMVGWQSLKWIRRREHRVGEELLRGLRIYARWILPGLLIAAVIEVYVTPYFLELAGG